jgi:hypothetical protein
VKLVVLDEALAEAIYHLSNLEVLVVAIAHAHRKPGYWKDRLA